MRKEIYRLRHVPSGLYWLGGGYLSKQWGPYGKIYRRLSDMKNSFGNKDLTRRKGTPYDPADCVIERYELTLVETKPYAKVLP